MTNLSGPMPVDPNQLLVEDGFRSVQKSTLVEGTYYMNPYTYRIELIDCRSQRFNLSEGFDMGFPSKDGFWVSLDYDQHRRFTADTDPASQPCNYWWAKTARNFRKPT